jgi:DNA-binding transcriptional LysR family regulator
MIFNNYPSANDLVYFLEIAEQLHLSRTATRLGVSQPTLSLALKRLEECVGHSLIERNGRKMSLTSQGNLLRNEAQKLLNMWQNLSKQFNKEAAKTKGKLKFGCHTSVGLYSLDKMLPSLLKSFPLIDIELKHGLSRHLCEEVISKKIDLALVINPQRHPDLILKKIVQDEVTFWKKPGAPEHRLICHPELLQTQSLLKNRKKGLPFTQFLTSESLENIAKLTAAGLGVGIIPERVVKSLSLSLSKITEWGQFQDELYLIGHCECIKKNIIGEILNHLKMQKI